MRFTIIKNIKKDKTMGNILNGLIIFILLYIITDFFVKHFSIGLSITDLNLSLFGNEEEFIEPLSQSMFLEFWHMEIFFIMMILLTLSTIYIRVVNNIKNYKFILNITMIFALISLTSLPLSFYISSFFSYLYVGGYFIWHFGALYMGVKSFIQLNKN